MKADCPINVNVWTETGLAQVTLSVHERGIVEGMGRALEIDLDLPGWQGRHVICGNPPKVYKVHEEVSDGS